MSEGLDSEFVEAMTPENDARAKEAMPYTAVRINPEHEIHVPRVLASDADERQRIRKLLDEWDEAEAGSVHGINVHKTESRPGTIDGADSAPTYRDLHLEGEVLRSKNAELAAELLAKGAAWASAVVELRGVRDQLAAKQANLDNSQRLLDVLQAEFEKIQRKNHEYAARIESLEDCAASAKKPGRKKAFKAGFDVGNGGNWAYWRDAYDKWLETQ